MKCQKHNVKLVPSKIKGYENSYYCPQCEATNKYDTLQQSHDDLLDALKRISDIEDEQYTQSGFDLEVNNIAKAAIAKTKPQKGIPSSGGS